MQTGIQFRTFLQRAARLCGLPRNAIRPYRALGILILLLGIGVRVWEAGRVPPGLHPDEASTALEAYDLYHFGVDRNGFSFPLQFVAYGSGMNALVYAYVLIPFIAIAGLSPAVVRLPMLISGIAMLPLAGFVARRTFGRRPALLAAFFVAISPWHIMQSRWGHDANFLPFVFLAAYACLLRSRAGNRWFLAAAALFALCLYVYGPAYAAIPAFLVTAVPVLYGSGRASPRSLAEGLLAFAILALPLGILLGFNALHLNTLHLGPLTLPRLPSEPRYETMFALGRPGFLLSLVENLWWTVLILTIQVDGIWTTLVPYGYFFTFTFPLAVLGLIALVRSPARTPERAWLLGWCAAALVVGTLVHSNFNHLNILFTPLILCVAYGLHRIRRRARFVTRLVLYVLAIAFLAFTRDYHSEAYRQDVGREFFSAGLLQAIEFAGKALDNPICITDSVKMPYLYVLFAEKPNPAEYLRDIEYIDPSEPFRRVRSLGRYAFGLENCVPDRRTVYILLSGENPPFAENNFAIMEFDRFQVFSPK